MRLTELASQFTRVLRWQNQHRKWAFFGAALTMTCLIVEPLQNGNKLVLSGLTHLREAHQLRL